MSKDKRGFASMSPEQQRTIASAGGRAVNAASRSFSKDRELAREAGRKGGKATKPQNRSFSQDRELAASAGRKGGMATKVHREGCMCDDCIDARTRAVVAARDKQAAEAPYLARRGGEPQRGELQDALKARKR